MRYRKAAWANRLPVFHQEGDREADVVPASTCESNRSTCRRSSTKRAAGFTASDLFEIFKDPERAWKKENLAAETEGFEMPRERLEWVRYEYRERALQKSISDQEDELRDLVARQKELKESLGFRREALERQMAERPEPKRTE